MEVDEPHFTKEEMESLVNYFKLLRKADRELLSKSIHKTKLNLSLIDSDQMAKFVGKNVYLPIIVKEEVQGKHWNFYYKFTKVVLKNYSKKNRSLTVKNPNGADLELEARDLFFENVGQDPQ